MLRNRIEVVEDDILVNRAYRECFDVVRAANILNRGYFDEGTLIAMLLNLRNRLRKGGLLVVCRTNDRNVNNGSILVLGEDGRLGRLARLNEGSEVEDLALNLPTPL
jgi:chemotaxis methyl-accepting protein methylase